MITASIVIPTYNRCDELRTCIEALAGQTASADSFEVVVVDDGSTDDTASMLSALELPFPLVVERQPNAGAAAARNRGIAAADGRWCIFLDDDIRADPGLVSGHVRAQDERGGIVGIGGLRIRPAGRRGGLSRFFADWWREHYRRYEEGEREPDFWGGYSGNLSAPREVLLAVGGFDESLARSEDVELAYRLERAGLPIAFVQQASGEQVYTKGFREIVRDFDRAGTSAVALWRRHPELLEHAPLGDFAQGGVKAVLARRILLALRAPVWPLAIADPFLARRPSPSLYRFLQLYCFWRSLRRELDDRDVWRRLTGGTLILMYHAVGGPGEAPSRFVVPPERLRRQLAWLRRRRPIISLDDYVRLRQSHRLPPARSVILTFDDGYADLDPATVTALRRAGAPATLFVVTGAVGGVNDWDDAAPLGGRALMSWDGLRALAASSFSIGSHTVDHPDLTALDRVEARRQMDGSGAEITRRIDREPRHLSYPYGRRNETVRADATEAGYASAVGITPGPNGPAVPLNDLRRMEVWGTRPLHRFMLDIWLGLHVGNPDRPREGRRGR